jgi:shikimate dehydrogenase
MKQVGLIGYPVAHSRSPQMHNAAFRKIGFDAGYILWETPPGTLAERVESLRAPAMLGANVTIPYKEDVVPLLDECDVLAGRIGAVNTIVHRNGKLVGYNTDAPGMVRALVECPGTPFDARDNATVILGTGGAGAWLFCHAWAFYAIVSSTLAFELWTGRDAPVEAMRNALGLK